jgi:hypothetical protein
VIGFFCGFLALLLHFAPGIVSPARAQGSRKDDIVFNSRGIPLAGATVRVCAMPASGQPCAPLALIYSDAALMQASANPTTTDGLGNYFFYAAPGKYEIEISGPAITTKQIPNVILPNDPSAPNFSSISSSGAISAFSLNLTGNLSVTGNTTVAGNLASGSLNLTNQGTPPGTPTSGSVNLYTKTADKRLYYKDDTGAEVGPIASGSGAQTNVPNTFTAQQNFDSDTRFGGPNPWYDLRKFGGYSSATTPPATTGSITSGQTTLTLANAQDFANGQGIVVYLAGPNTSLTTPAQPTVTPINLSGGATTYNYKAVAEDRKGALTPAGIAGTTTTGAATLGANNISLTSCVRTGGVTTYTATGTHNLIVGAQVGIGGFSTFSLCNGVKTIASTPSGTTFTTNDGFAAADENATASAAVTVHACNKLDFPAGTYSGSNAMRYWIYRSTGAGAFALIGVAQGIDPFFLDCGLPAATPPSYIPSTPPGAAQPGYLATTIVSGGGSTSLTLANAAANTATTQSVLHDNSAALLACVQAAFANQSGGGACYIPNPNAAFNSWVFNATTDFTTLTRGNFASRIHLAGDVTLNQSWVLASNMDLEGEPRGGTSFNYVTGSGIGGNAYPLLYAQVLSSVHLNRLRVSASLSQQTGFLTDQNSSTGGSVGIVSDDVAYNGNNGNNTPVILKSGFDYYFYRGVITNNGSVFGPMPSFLSTINSAAVVGNITNNLLIYRMKIEQTEFDHRGIVYDCTPMSQNFFTHGHEFRNILYESMTAPFFRINNCGGNSSFSNMSFSNIEVADSLVGFGTPVVDAFRNTFIGFDRVGAANGQPLFIGRDATNAISTSNMGLGNFGNATYFATLVGGAYTSGTLGMSATSRFFATLSTLPPAPNLVLSAGGAIPLGTHTYQVSCVDVEGFETLLGPGANITTTSGNQTVSISVPSLPLGCTGWMAYRDGFRDNATGGPVAPTFTAVDSTSFTHGDSSPASNNAGILIADATRVAAPLLQHIDTTGFTVSTGVSTPLTANRTARFPDATGTIAFKDTAQTWSANQTNLPLITPSIAGETISAAPRALWTAFLPGALTSTWTGATWTTDKAVTITRVQLQAKTAPSGCTTNAVVRLTDGASPVNVTIAAATNDSGAITQNYAAAAALTIVVQTAAAGCATSPADVNVVVQYRMQ